MNIQNIVILMYFYLFSKKIVYNLIINTKCNNLKTVQWNKYLNLKKCGIMWTNWPFQENFISAKNLVTRGKRIEFIYILESQEFREEKRGEWRDVRKYTTVTRNVTLPEIAVVIGNREGTQSKETTWNPK